MRVRCKWIPKLLDDRYNKMTELRAAEDLLISLQESRIATETEISFTMERIQDLKAFLSATEAETEKIIDGFSHDTRVWNFLRLKYILGYSWVDIALQTKIPEETVKIAVYRAFQKTTSAEHQL